MRSFSLGSPVLVLGLACAALVTACSDDTGEETLPLTGGGSGGTSSAGANAAGTDTGGSAGDMGGSGGMGGEAVAGSAGMAGGSMAGSAGMAGSGMGGSDMGLEPDAGLGEPDAGFVEPDAGGVQDDDGDDDVDEDPQIEPLSFAADIYPTMFGVGRCDAPGSNCHGAGDSDFRGDYGSEDLDEAYAAVSGNIENLQGRVSRQEMPPNCANDPNRDCFTPEELELLQAWIDQGTPE